MASPSPKTRDCTDTIALIHRLEVSLEKSKQSLYEITHYDERKTAPYQSLYKTCLYLEFLFIVCSLIPAYFAVAFMVVNATLSALPVFTLLMTVLVFMAYRHSFKKYGPLVHYMIEKRGMQPSRDALTQHKLAAVESHTKAIEFYESSIARLKSNLEVQNQSGISN